MRLAKRAHDAEVNGFRAKYEQKEREIDQKERQMLADQEMFRHRIKTDTEKALSAFYEEIKSNPAALAAFATLQKAVEAAVA